MYPPLASFLQALAAWTQSASQAVPLSQLSLIAWMLLAASRSLVSSAPFNDTERQSAALSKMSFQKVGSRYPTR
jgi:hypothetical protein